MYIDKPDYTGPRCHVCNSPEISDYSIKVAKDVASTLSYLRSTEVSPRYYCSTSCVSLALEISS